MKNYNAYKEIIKYEREMYSNYMFPSRIRYNISRFKLEPARLIWKWQRYARLTDYFYSRRNGCLYYKIMYILMIRMRNKWGMKLGIEISTRNIAKGLLIYHFNNVVNSNAIIGENCHLHGGNVIGNAGPNDRRCPIIGDNVMLGAGAKVIGAVRIADGIKVAAGAVVVKSFEEPNITIAGIPAHKVKDNE